MMITLGILLTIDHYGQFSIWRTWPLLVIVFGVLKLGERAVAPSVNYPPGPPVGNWPGGIPK